MFELICYLNFGYPTIEESIKAADNYISCGCKSIQLDIPSRDPYLENDEVKRRMAYCLQVTPDYEDYFEGIRELRRRHPDVKFYFMLYENIVDELGVVKITEFCREVGIEYSTYVGTNEVTKKALTDAGLSLACYIRFHLPDDEIAFAADSKWILLQAKNEGYVRPGCETFAKCVQYIRDQGLYAPIYASVGIRTPEDVKEVKSSGSDGAFIGTILMSASNDKVRLNNILQKFISASKE